MSSSQICMCWPWVYSSTQSLIYCVKDVEFVSFMRAGEGDFVCPGTRGRRKRVRLGLPYIQRMTQGNWGADRSFGQGPSYSLLLLSTKCTKYPIILQGRPLYFLCVLCTLVTQGTFQSLINMPLNESILMQSFTDQGHAR